MDLLFPEINFSATKILCLLAWTYAVIAPCVNQHLISTPASPSIQGQTAPMIQKVRRNAIPAGHDRDAGAFLQRLFHDPHLLARGPAAPAAAIGDLLSFESVFMS